MGIKTIIYKTAGIIILSIIRMVEKYEYRNLQLDENDHEKKIINSISVNNIEVLSDNGFLPLSHIHSTQQYTEYELITNTGKYLKCANEHRVFRPDMSEVFVDELNVNDEILTIDGIESVHIIRKNTNKYGMFDITVDHPTHRFYSNGILSHQTITSAIFITWYLLFNVDKNVIVLANKARTAEEIIDKIKTVIKGVPFFLKPGVAQNNVMTMKFDNGCRLIGQATTKTAAIGFTLHLVYMDEFAHIQPTFLEPFYRSVYPTVAASKISRVIITSTPNGRNKFFQIYDGAVRKENEYTPLRVDWWEVPGRDEAWKKREISNLGSEEMFNQEYGNQFLAGDSLLLGGNALRAMKRIAKKYKYKEISELDDLDIDYSELKWHKSFSFYDIPNSKFIISIDIADGAGKDFSIINIFKVEPMSIASIRKMSSDRIEDESSFFRLRQVGLYRSNSAGVDELVKICNVLFFKLFNPDDIRISLEINFKGELFIEKLARNPEYYEEMFLHTCHNTKTTRESIGIKLHQHNKMYFCRDLRKLILEKRIVLNESATFDEMNDFGINSRGSYTSQSSHDDIAMTCVNLSPMLSSYTFSEVVEEMHDGLSDELKNAIQKKLENTDVVEDTSYFNIMKEKPKYPNLIQ